MMRSSHFSKILPALFFAFLLVHTPQVFAQRGEFTLQVVDAETRKPLACSIFVRNQAGVAQKAVTLPFSYDHFVSPGEAVMSLPLGTYPLEIERGLEYYPVKGHFVLNRSAKDTKVEKLRRFTDLPLEGWWSGDLNVQRPSREMGVFMMAGDVHVATLLQDEVSAQQEEKWMADAKTAKEKKAAKKLTAVKKPAHENSEDDENAVEHADAAGEDENPREDVRWCDQDRVYSTRNYLLNREGCTLALLNLSAPLAKTVPRLAKNTPASGEEAGDAAAGELSAEATLRELIRLRKAEPEMVMNVLDADSWDIPALAAMGLLDAFELLGPCVTRDRLLPRDMAWEKFPKVKTAAKLDMSRFSASSRNSVGGEKNSKNAENTQKRPSEHAFLKGTSPMQYAGTDGQQRWAEQVYFHLLNTGHQVVPSAGSGSGQSVNGVGANRVYVHVDGSEYRRRVPEKSGFAEEGGGAAYDWQAWWEAFRRGEVVITNGPLMQPHVEGCYPGELLEYDQKGPISLETGLKLATREKIQYLEFIVNGKVTQTVRLAEAAKVNRLPPVEIERSGWFMLRAVTDSSKTYCVAMSAPYYVKLEGKRYISRRSAEFFLNWQQERVRMLEAAGLEGKTGERIMECHRFALDYWEKMVKNATAE